MNRFAIALIAAFGMSSGSVAIAADLPHTAVQPTVSPSVANDWTGFHAGIFGGIAASQHTLTVVPTGGGAPLAIFDFTGNGGLLGAQVGYDYDAGNFLVGAYADIALSNVRMEISGSSGVGPGSFDFKAQLNYLGTLQARAGGKWDNVLAYVHGGLAYGSTEQTLSLGGGGPSPTTQSRRGYVVGAGLEYALSDSVSFQTEYSYVDLGDAQLFSTGGTDLNGALRFHMVKAGLNYRF